MWGTVSPRAKSQMTGLKRAREQALKERRERKAEKKRAARDARAASVENADVPSEAHGDPIEPSDPSDRRRV